MTNVGSLSDLLGVIWVRGKGELVFLFLTVLLEFSVEKYFVSRSTSPSKCFLRLYTIDQLIHYVAYYQNLYLGCQCLYW